MFSVLYFRSDVRAQTEAAADVEPCVDVIVSAATRRAILVCGSPLATKKNFSKVPEKNFVLSSKFSDDLFPSKIATIKVHSKNGIGRADKLSVAAVGSACRRCQDYGLSTVCNKRTVWNRKEPVWYCRTTAFRRNYGNIAELRSQTARIFV